MKQLVYITGSGHSGSTLLDRLLGSHPDIAALGEIHRFSLGLHRDETPFRCDCGAKIDECTFWIEVMSRVTKRCGIDSVQLYDAFKTTDHSVLGQPSGKSYFNQMARYQFFPADPEKYILALIPKVLAPILDRIGLLGEQLSYARSSHTLYQAVSEVTGASTIVDSTKNPLRMRALHLTAPHTMKVIYLSRDGRAVANSRMQRQSISMEEAAKIWVAENRKISIVLRSMKEINVLNVSYEELCSSPEDEMGRILNFLHLPKVPATLAYERHAIGGNPSRFNIEKKISLDEKWRKELSLTDIEIFDRIAGGENKHLSGSVAS